MSYYVSSNREAQRRARFPENKRREGLPGDDWHNLGRAQRRDDLEDHFYHNGNLTRAYQRRPTAYADAGLSQDRRLDISQVRNATRSALGPSFDPFDESSYEPSRCRDQDYGSSHGWTAGRTGDTTMPRSYCDDYERTYRDNGVQYEDDRAFNAAWRNHDRLDPRDHYRGETSSHSHRRATAASPSRRVDDTGRWTGDYDSTHLRPNQASRMSWDSDDEPPRREVFSFFHR